MSQESAQIHVDALSKALGVTVMKAYENPFQHVYHHQCDIDIKAAEAAGLLVIEKDDVATPTVVIDGMSFVIVNRFNMITREKQSDF